MADRQMSLSNLLQGIAQPLRDAFVQGIALDSRQVKPGFAFVALSGHEAHGLDYLEDALARGASAVLCDRAVELPYHLGFARVDTLAEELGEIAARFYTAGADRARVMAVTGTNGKTSTVNLIAQLLDRLGQVGASVGTLGFQIANDTVKSNNTTPDIFALHAFMAEAQAQGAHHVAIEASSHGLAQGRMAGLNIRTVAITNITQDHLDYHKSMAAYIEAKAKILDFDVLESVVIDCDDPNARALTAKVSSSLRLTTFSFDAAAEVDVVVVPSYGPTGTRASLFLNGTEVRLETPLVGEFYLRNLITAVLMLVAEGFDLHDLLRASATLAGVPGRLQRVEATGDIQVFVDYAHTPDALSRVLGVLRPAVQNHLWVVFGCGGDRDRSKRALMGDAAAASADKVVLTSDNPRSECPEKILADISQSQCRPVAQIVDRKEAIEFAIDAAQPGDIVVLAGKGHETEQVLNDKVIPFSDYQVAFEALNKRACA